MKVSTNEVKSYKEEIQRIRAVYQQRKQGSSPDKDSSLEIYSLCALQEREQLLLELLRRKGVKTLAGMNILDVGCGEGLVLRHLLDYGAEPDRCLGIDLIEERLLSAHSLNANIHFVGANGAQLPFADASFDFALQFTLFTSVLEPAVKEAIANEILRILRSGGMLMWYDFSYNNPRNPNVRGLGRREIRQLFRGCKFQFHRVTLAPPVGRFVVRISPVLYHLLSRLKILSTHYLCLIEKP